MYFIDFILDEYEAQALRGLRTCPVFSNLTRLVMGEWCMVSDFLPVLFILHRSLKLKHLTFKLRMVRLLPDMPTFISLEP